MLDFLAVTLVCLGVAPTTPKTNVEIEIRPNKFSTIRYEFAEGSLQGTAYVQSIGRMEGSRWDDMVLFVSDLGIQPSMLILGVEGDKILQANFYHYSSGMNGEPVNCTVETE